MASIVLGTVGAIVGGIYGGPTGAQVGWAVGSAIGGAVTPGPHSEAARMTDLTVQASTYGVMIPILYGTNRVAGNIIWSTDLVETEHEESSGKGGGGATVSTFTYSVSFVVALCDGEILGIRRIWANNRLLLDASASNTGITGQSGNIRVIPGTTTQLPSALMESHLGAGNVSAYRGTAGCEFEDFQLEDYGNRLPNLTFEVVKAGTEAVPAVTSYATGYTGFAGSEFGTAGIGNQIWGFATGSYPANNNVLLCFDSITNEIILANEVAPAATGDVYQGLAFVPTLNEVWIATNDGQRWVHVHDALTGARKETITIPGTQIFWTDILYIPATDSVAVFSAETIVYNAVNRLALAGVTSTNYGSNKVYAVSAQYVWIAPINFSGAGIPAIMLADLTTGDLIQRIGPENSRYTALCFDTKRTQAVLWSADLGQLVIVDEETLAITYNNITDGFTASALLYLEEQDKYFGINANFYFVLNADTLAVEHKIGHAAGFTVLSDVPTIANVISGNGSTTVHKFPYTERITPGQAMLSDIVTEICGKVGQAASDIDVTQLTDAVDGYAIAQQMPARSAIETLQPIYFFDAVESD